MTDAPEYMVTLLAGNVPAEQVRRLTGRFPSVRFAVMPREGPVPEDARVSRALLTIGQPLPAFEDTLAALPRLAWVHTASAGVDRHMPALRGAEFQFTRTAGARAVPIAEHVLAMTLALLKRLPELFDSQRQREWRRTHSTLVAGSTVGVIGAGAIGRAAAARFKALGARTLGLTRSGEPLPEFDEVWAPDRLHDLLSESDVVLVACPLTPETRGMLGAAQFSAMREGAYLVNVARGGIVVEVDLLTALRAGELAGAALDVFEVEPLPPDSPFWSLDNVIVTPHCSSAAPDVWDEVIDEFAANLERFLLGEPLLNLVDVEGRGY